jgi:hypothetical protein
VAVAADDDTANTSPNLPKNNNYSISLLKKSNIKNTPPLMASPRRLHAIHGVHPFPLVPAPSSPRPALRTLSRHCCLSLAAPTASALFAGSYF